jgi:predicted RNase H-like HicB family nuclease
VLNERSFIFIGSFGEKVLESFKKMRTIKYTFWQDGEFYLGFLNDYPDYETQGYSKEELLDNLKSLLEDIESEEIPFIRKVEELAIAE